MAHRFIIQSSPPASPDAPPRPSTPDRRSHPASSFPYLGAGLPSTTPAGPPPSSVASLTPAGAPSDAYMPGSNPPTGASGPASKPFAFGSQPQGSSARSLFRRAESSASAPLGRSIRGARQLSALSRQITTDQDVDEEEDEGEGEGEGEGEDEDEEGDGDGYGDEDAEGEYEDENQDASGEELSPQPGSLFKRSGRPGARRPDIDPALDRILEAEVGAKGAFDDSGKSVSSGESQDDSDDGDIFLNMRHDDRPYGQPVIGDDGDLIMLQTPAATERIRKEAETIYRRSTAHPGALVGTPRFASIARGFYTQHEPARLTEAPSLVLKSEELVCRLYDEGVGTEYDAEKMDNSLANISYRLVELWDEHAQGLPQPEGEDFATVGPGSRAEPFAKAAYLANLVLRMHHTRFDDDADDDRSTPLPDVLFSWLRASHNLYPNQVRDVGRHKPSPACHGLYWQTLRCALLRGDVRGASHLLSTAGWEHVRGGPRGEAAAYTGEALDNIRRFAGAACDMLAQCPGIDSDWDVYSSNWTLFRVQARGYLDRLTLFAEGREARPAAGFALHGAESMSSMARKASSRIPWDVYANLQTVYGIVLGDQGSILETAQDWCEATIGLFGWCDDGGPRRTPRASLGASARRLSGATDYEERLASAFHVVLRSDMSPNALNPVEVAIAAAFEGDVEAVIGCLRAWSLPLATSVAEVASLGQWLPPARTCEPLPTDTLDMDDLALLGVPPPSTDDMEGIKDTTMVLYARELAGVERLSPHRDGWEIAIQVLGRMDNAQKSEETVGELLRDLLATLDDKSGPTVDKMWRILNDLGMLTFAEETAEAFADILSRESRRYGEALWYYALSHRADRVREVLNLLMSYSLVLSTAFPPEKELDGELRDLLRKRGEVLERRAGQDIEAAQLLGRMLSGYATLRKFYELRDGGGPGAGGRAAALKRQAALALVAVVSSADDNIRGGLYDESCEAVVSQDLLLALLGEATVFVGQSPPAISLEQMDIVLKAIEDMETVGSGVRETCSDFLGLVLSSGQGLKGSTPADLMSRSTGSLGGSSYVLSGSSMLASRMHKMLDGAEVRRGWDWRRGWPVGAGGGEVLRRLRLGLARDLSALWLAEADGVAAYD